MSIEAIAPLGAEAIPTITAKAAAAPDFAQWMTQQIGEVNQQISGAETQLRQLAVGETGNLHQVMLDLEKARLAFQLTLQVRNKVLEGYQEIMRMQL